MTQRPLQFLEDDFESALQYRRSQWDLNDLKRNTPLHLLVDGGNQIGMSQSCLDFFSHVIYLIDCKFSLSKPGGGVWMGVSGQELLNESENVRQYSDIGLCWSKTWTFKGHKSQHGALFISLQPKFPISNKSYYWPQNNWGNWLLPTYIIFNYAWVSWVIQFLVMLLVGERVKKHDFVHSA